MTRHTYSLRHTAPLSSKPTATHPQALEAELAAAAAGAAAEEGHVRLLASHAAGVRLEIKHAQGRVSS